MDKEKIISNAIMNMNNPDATKIIIGVVKTNAMFMATGFADWLVGNNISKSSFHGFWVYNKKSYTTAELYKEFITTIKQ